jgi:ribonucleotide reductase alpha subunit
MKTTVDFIGSENYSGKVGVGFDVKGANQVKLYAPLTDESTYIIEDTREAWVESVKKLLLSYFVEGQPTIKFDYSNIRKEGEIIKTFGGKASGYKALLDLHETIRAQFIDRQGQLVTTTDIVDVMNKIGVCVVAGNVRRTAEIVFGNPYDAEYLKLKDYRWNNDKQEYEGSAVNRASFGWTSNNSVDAVIGMDYTELAKQTAVNGEPGYFWSVNARAYSRMSDEPDWKDIRAKGANPCFHPDTLIETVNGRIKIKDIKEPTFVYSMDENGKLCIRQASAAFKTKSNTALVRVTLKNGSYLEVTPAHKLYVVNRGWIEASNLTTNDSLVHLSRTRRGKRYSGVRLSTQIKAESIMEHRLVYQSINGILPINFDVHHKDGNTFNNSIANLEALLHSEHAVHTATWDNPQKHQQKGLLGRFISPIKKYLPKIKDVPAELKTTLNNQFSTLVVSIEKIDNSDVYDITVPGTNCLIANNIVAHNCGEQTLESYEMCCLVETFPTLAESLDDFKRTLKFAYLYAKTVTLGNTHWVETNRVMLRNRRIGTSVSGIAQFLDKNGIDTLKNWLRTGYTTVQTYDSIYSDWLAVPRSIKTTSIKPSGTVSLLPGVTPGIHFPESNHYIRRMRLSSKSELLPALKNANYNIEKDQNSENTLVVSIPVSIEGVRTIDQVSMWEQLQLASFMQEHWSDNQVSVTITFKPYEKDQIKDALNYFQYKLKAVSFLPKLEKGAYNQMPYETISKEQYDDMLKQIKPLKFKSIAEESKPEVFCDGDSCTIL